MTVPRATMRLQLHKGFGFDDAAYVAPYMARLGISHVYCSPILTARAGSMHGYDATDPTRINPELGGEAGFRRMVATLRDNRVGLIVDIVPNHMAIGSANAWWQDVLRHGLSSRYADFFDIGWHPDNPLLDGKLLLPVLGRQYGNALTAGEITLQAAPEGWQVRYFSQAFPIAPADQSEVDALGPDAYATSTDVGRARLHRLLQRQHYRLAWWRTAPEEINWRRFFDINELVGMRVELPTVFEATHALLFRLYKEGLIDGMRVDHVDGLADPGGYCRRLHARLTELAPDRMPYLVIEKILGRHETLACDWCVDGTSGYDFMDTVSAVQHDAAAQPALEALWATLSGRPGNFQQEAVPAKRETLDRSFAAQLEATVGALHAVALQHPETQDASRTALRRALIELLAHFPTYRSYATADARPDTDAPMFAQALDGALRARGLADPWLLSLLVDWLSIPDTPARQIAARRFQQLSAPVAAKAVEDTAFYRYGRLLSRNDVGFDAARLGIEPAEFHQLCAARRDRFPDAMLATATHDHKRGEDVRARLAVLSEIPDEWAATLRRWMAMNAPHRGSADGQPAPSPGDEIMLYQTLLGAWPTTLQSDDHAARAKFVERIASWQEKALHEAKLRTSWTSRNESYETAARDFLGAIMRSGFSAEVGRLSDRIGPAGAVNGLAQVLLKLTVPGVPDFYQGTEFWDQTLVDPDNRRPVDFAQRLRALDDAASPVDLAASWRDGRVKQAIIARGLDARRRDPTLFMRGDYRPLLVEGQHAAHVIAFVRRTPDAMMIAVAPRLPLAVLQAGDGILIPPTAWRDTALCVPDGITGRFADVLTGVSRILSPGHLPVADLLTDFSLALLIRQDR
ncbi:MAG TPA: malto-oligosyltrehalose synthase [Acetobacteraceae bacterium]|nr:malto-oligosyltrehalose synthase [Acetobacteraceae bacterium]